MKISYTFVNMNNTKAEDKCPVCDGTGVFVLPKKMQIDSAEIKKKLAKELIKKGYSYRQVQKALGYKSTQSVSYWVNQK